MVRQYLKFSGAVVLWLFLLGSLWNDDGFIVEDNVGKACGLTFLVMAPLQMWQRRPSVLDSLWRGGLWGVFVVYAADLFWAYNFGHCGRTVWPTVLLFDVLPGFLILVSLWVFARNPHSENQNRLSASPTGSALAKATARTN